MSRLCAGAQIVRPLRAKHCAVTGRCVAMFDHFCPWVGNCIGAGNRHYFAGFLWLELGAILIAGRPHLCAGRPAHPAACGLIRLHFPMPD